MAESLFEKMLAAVRSGDEASVADLLSRHEHNLRRVIGLRLNDPKLRRLFDTMDIYQSVVLDFLKWVPTGGAALQSPEHLGNMLTRMVRLKILAKARAAKNRPHGLPDDYDLAAAGPTPSRVVATEDLARFFLARIADDADRRLVERRFSGLSWEEVAEGTGQSADLARIKVTRLIERLRRDYPEETNGDE